MKKIFKKAIPYIVFALLLYFVHGQEEYYINEDVLNPSYKQWFIFCSVLFAIIVGLSTWASLGKESFVITFFKSIPLSFLFTWIIVFMLYSGKHIIRGGILYLNRLHSTKETMYKSKVYGLENYYFVEHISNDKDTTFIRVKKEFANIKTEDLKYGDTLAFEMKTGIFGLEYPNFHKYEIFPSEQ